MIETALIATLPAHPNLEQNIEFILAGFLFVILVLLILAGITQIVGLFFKTPAAPKKDTSALPAQAAPPSAAESGVIQPQQGEELDPALTAVIVAAAVHAVIGDRPHRILSIRPAQHGWAQEGRRQIFSSHSVR